MKNKNRASLFFYFIREKKLLALTAIAGLACNIGMTAGPFFEGQLAQYLFDILKGSRKGRDIVVLSIVYAAVISAIQGARALKRLFVRKFANNVSRSMKESIYHHIVHEPVSEIHKEDAGAVMTRSIADADACAEGMRKFTTELFDTGVVMVSYLAMLFFIDWKLTFIVILFPPAAYIAAAALKKKVSKSSQASKLAMSELSNAAVDNAGHALTYRIYGEDKNRAKSYEKYLSEYERRNVAAGILQNSPQPIYLVISMLGVVPVLWLGGKNVLGTGWTLWSIASFSSFLSCFSKLAKKSSHAAKLFNAVQKAEVSWERIKSYLTDEKENLQDIETEYAGPAELVMKDAGFKYEDGAFELKNLNLEAKPGEIIGITGKVASGKSTFGKIFLNESRHTGKITYGGKEISGQQKIIFAYEGHNPELFTGSVRENVAFGGQDEKRIQKTLEEVQIDGEVTLESEAGMEGSELSGGQQARLALARALYSKAPVLILDDPFSAVDAETEKKIFESLRKYEKERIILLISHRLALFPEMDKVALIENGTIKSGTHTEMMKNKTYASLYELQLSGGNE